MARTGGGTGGASDAGAPAGGAGAGGAGAGGSDLVLDGLTKRFADFVAVDGISLRIPRGSFFALLGPSGCGKTTTLRMVAGLEQPTAGRITIGDSDITLTKPYKRPVNTVFQSYALFPHLDVFENVAFGLRRRRTGEVKRRVTEALDLVELGHAAKRKPGQLSGGQQQRVALARAIVNRPEVLLLDEPLGALDLKLRRQMQIELKRIQTEVGLTFVHVTHDQEEAMTMADTIAVMNGGRIEQLGAPADLYESPATTFVANFLGQSNLLRATGAAVTGDTMTADVRGNRISLPRERAATAGTGDVLIGVRPEKIKLAATSAPTAEGANTLRGGVVSDASFTGVSTQYLVRMPWGQELTVFAQNMGAGGIAPVGTAVTLVWDPAYTFTLPADQDVEAGVEREEPAGPAASGSAAGPAATVAVG
jgi:spermidine/putrescine transport system ATP-binding protein